MAKSVSHVIGGIFCCIEPPEPWCRDCPYEGVYDCKNILRNDISYWAQQGKLKLGKNGTYEIAESGEPKVKTKRKNGRRYSDGERRKGRHEEYSERSDGIG